MEYKKIIVLTIFLLCNITANGETYMQRQYNDIAPLLSKQNLTEEDIAILMKFKTKCENEIVYEKKSINFFINPSIQKEHKPLTKFISDAFKDNFSSPLWTNKILGDPLGTLAMLKDLRLGDPLGILAMFEGLRLTVSYGFFPITVPMTLFVSIGKWWEAKKLRKYMIQRSQEYIKLCEEYIRKVEFALSKTTSP